METRSKVRCHYALIVVVAVFIQCCTVQCSSNHGSVAKSGVGVFADEEGSAWLGEDDPRTYAMVVSESGSYQYSRLDLGAASLTLDAPVGSTVTISVWVSLSQNQLSTQRPIILSTGAGWSTTPNDPGVTVYWNTALMRLELDLVTTNGTRAFTAAAGLGLIPLDASQWRLLTLTISPASGYVQVFVDTVLDFAKYSQVLLENGMTNFTAHTNVVLGCTTTGSSCITGSIADIRLMRRPVTIHELRMSYQFSLLNNEHYADAQVYRFSSAGTFSFPGSSVTSGARVYLSGLELPLHRNITVTAQNVSWTVLQAWQLKCGANQSFILSGLPSDGPWYVHIALSAVPADPFQINLFRSMNSSAADDLWPLLTLTSPTATFVFQGTSIVIKTQGSTDAYCFNTTVFVNKYGRVSLETGAASSAPGVIFASESTVITALSGIHINDSFALIEFRANEDFTACRQASAITVSSLGSEPYTIAQMSFVAPIDDGIYSVCVFPGGRMTSQVFLAAATSSFVARLSVAPLPTNGRPLGRTWMKTLLHLGNTSATAIPNGNLDTDYFQLVGGEASIRPQMGDQLFSQQSLLFWTPIQESTGFWGVRPNSGGQWVHYSAAAIYSFTSQQAVFSFLHCDGLVIYFDGNRVYRSTECQPDTLRSTPSLEVSQGWHQLLFKHIRGNADQPFFAIRLVQGSSLSWASSIPGNPRDPQVVNYTDYCSEASSSWKQCIPGATLSQQECYNIGCCFYNNTCVAPANQPRYRSDGRCGSGFAALGATPAECNPFSSAGATCCSNHQWCGIGAAWCDCDSCANFKYTTLKHPRCTYMAWGTQTKCVGVTQQTLPDPKTDVECRKTCDFTEGCSAYTLRKASAYSSTYCTLVFGDCNTTMQDDTSATYRALCTNCTFVDTTGVNCRNLDITDFLGAGMSLDACKRQCQMISLCVGITFQNGECNMLRRPCTLTAPSNNASAVVSNYTCGPTNLVPPEPLQPPLPPLPNNTKNDFSGQYAMVSCFYDYTASLLSSSWYNRNFIMDQYNMSLNFCYSYCMKQGAQFFGVTQGTICMCGVRYPTYSQIPFESACNESRCSGNESERCGGYSRTVVYRMKLREDPRVCMSGYYQFNDRCFKYVQIPQSWSNANKYCRSDGGTLASIDDMADNQFVLSLPYLWNETNPSHLWAGGISRSRNEAGVPIFEWLDGTLWDYSDWIPGEPNSHGGTENEDCLEMYSDYPTSREGSWNDLACYHLQPFVCAMPLSTSNDTATVMEPSYTQTLGSFSCSANGESLSTRKALQLWLPLAEPSGMNMQELSGKNRTATITFDPASPSFHPPPQFESGVTSRQALTFALGDFVDSGTWSVGGMAITLAAWVKPTTANDTVIISKTFSSTAVKDQPVYAWALTIERGVYCFVVAFNKACSKENVQQKAWTHVLGAYDGVSMFVALDGEISTTVIVQTGANGSVALAQTNTRVLVGYHDVAPYVDKLVFRGAMNDVRVYQGAISTTLAKFFHLCTPLSAPARLITAYAGVQTSVALFGRRFDEDQRIWLTSSCDGTYDPLSPVGYSPIHIKIPKESLGDTATLTIPSAVTWTGLSAPLALCTAALTSPSVFTADTTFRIHFTRADTINGTKTLNVDVKQFPIRLQLEGSNLEDNQVIVLTYLPGCTMPAGSMELFNSRSNATLASAIFSKPAMFATGYLYLCWGPSPAAKDTSNYLVDTGLKLFVSDANSNRRMVRVASFDGSRRVTSSDYRTGKYYDADNYVFPCQDVAGNVTDNFYIYITMGAFTDYFIPLPNVSLCDLLTMKSPNKKLAPYRYISMDPSSNLFAGYIEDVPPGPSGWLGGSVQAYPRDNRQFLSFWGSDETWGSPQVGGCCASSAVGSSSVQWYQPFNIVFIETDPTDVYLYLPFQPSVVYAGENYTIEAQVLDIHGYPVNKSVTFTIWVSGLERPVVLSGGANAHVEWDVLAPNRTGATLQANISISGVTAQNGNVASWSIEVVSKPGNAKAGLMSDAWITNFLVLGKKGEYIPTLYNDGHMTDFLSRSGGEASQTPKNADTVTPDTMSNPHDMDAAKQP